MYRFINLFLFFVFSTAQLMAQSQTIRNATSQGNLYFYWGWNVSGYTDTDMKFTGPTHNFELKSVHAVDRPTPFNPKDYFHPLYITQPQYNARVGYFFADQWDVSIGVDHMKYVVKDKQQVAIEGSIYNTGTDFDGVYQGEKIEITPPFLRLEHTDGLNYVNLELKRHLQLKNIYPLHINALLGGGFGRYIPRTDVQLMNLPGNNEWHWAGYGTHLVTGLNLTFYNRFFIQSEWRGGYVNLNDVRSTSSPLDKAQQKFLFSQLNLLFGYTFPLIKRKKPAHENLEVNLD